MTIKNINFFLFFSLLFFLFVRICLIGSIHAERELPIEVDDTYVYITKSVEFQNQKPSLFTPSSRKIIEDTFLLNNDVPLLQRFMDRSSSIEPYFLYSFLLKLINKHGFSYESVLWLSYYFTQVLLLLSVFFASVLFFPVKSKILPFAIFLLTFTYLEFIHQITATPFSIGNALLLISLGLIFNYKQYIAIILLITSLLFHPGIFVVALTLISSFIFYSYFYDGKKKLRLYIYFFVSILLILLVDLISIKIFDLKTFTYFFSAFDESSKTLPLYEIFKFNIKEFFYRFTDLLDFYSLPNFGILIYVLSLYLTLQYNKKLFVSNIFFLFLVLLSLFHYLPQHPAELIEYFGQFYMILILYSFLIFYRYVFISVRNTRFKKLNIFFIFFLIYLVSLFLIKTYDVYQNRSERQNLSNYSTYLLNLNKEYAGRQIIISDQITYLMGRAYLPNLSVIFDDDILDNIIWDQKNCDSEVLYFGKVKNLISACGKNYLIHNYILNYENEYSIIIYREI